MKKCYYKPNRTKKPKWTTCDVARVSRYARASGAQRNEIVATVAFEQGYYSVIDGTKLTEGELKSRIEQLMKVSGTLSDILDQIPVFSRLGLTIRIVSKFAGSFAFLAAGVAILAIKEETIVGVINCKKPKQ